MAVVADKVVVELQARLDKYRADLARADRDFAKRMASMRTNAGLTEKRTTKSFRVISMAGTAMAASLRNAALGLATIAGGAAAVRILANFSQAMSTVSAVTNATGTEFTALEDKARSLGATTRFSATQAAEGMIFLARAGFNTEQVLGAIEGTLRLAQAGNLDLARAADIASNVLQGFRLEVAETARVVDVLALAANSSNTDVSQLGEAMKYAAPIAAGLGVGVEDTAAAVSALSDAGLQASTAGTGLRRVMIGLETQGKAGQKILAKYGLTMEDISMSATGSLANSLERLADAGITTADAIALFGLRGGPAFEVLQSSIPKVRALTDAYNEAGGTAERIAAVMDDNLNGALLATRSRLEELILALGDAGATDALLASLEGLRAILIVAAENADILGIALVALTIRAVLPMAAAMGGRAIAAVAGLRAQLLILTAIAGTTTTTLGTLGAVAGRFALIFSPLSIAIAAAAAAYIVLARNVREGKEAIETARASIERMNKALKDTDDFSAFENLSNDAKFANPVIERLKDTLDGVADAVKRIGALSIAQQASTLVKEIDAAKTALEDLEKKRAQTISRRRTLLAATTRGESNFEGLDASKVTEFDAEINKLKGSIIQTEERLRAVGRGITGPGGVDVKKAFEEGGFEGLAKAVEARFTGIVNESIIAAEFDNITALQEQLTTARDKGLENAAERFQQQIDIAQETIRLLEAGIDEVTAREVARETVQDRQTDDGGSALDKETMKALDEVRTAYRQTFESEREMIARIRDERLAAIDAAKVGEEQAAQLREQANAVYERQLSDIREKEFDGYSEYLDEIQEKADKEISLLDEITRARDEMSGRVFALLERDYQARLARIEDEIDDEVRKNEAILALDEEFAQRRQDLEDRALGKGASSSNEVERLRAEQEDKLELLEEWYAENLDREQEYLDRKLQINEETEALITQLRREAAVAQLDAVGKGFDAAGDLAKKFAGENSAIYKALFIAEKAAALASAYVQMNLAVAKAAAAAPPPANVPLIAAAKATGLATIAGIAASAITGFATGVVGLRGKGSGTSDDIPAMLSNGESVITAAGTRKNEDLLRQINAGADVQGQLERIRQPINVSPAVAARSNSVSVGGSTIQFNGPVNDDSIPAIRALIDARDRDLEDRVRSIVSQDRRQTTPRHARNRFLRD